MSDRNEFLPPVWQKDLLSQLASTTVMRKMVFGPSPTMRVRVPWPLWKRIAFALFGRAWNGINEIGDRSGFLMPGYEPKELVEPTGWKTVPNPNYVEPDSLKMVVKTKPTWI